MKTSNRVELGQMCFASNTISNYVVPDFVIVLIRNIYKEAQDTYWNINQKNKFKYGGVDN